MKKSFGPKVMPFPAPVWVVGTYDAEGKPNMMTASWTGICCSKPPCIAVSVRKSRYSYSNIVARQAFTICVPSGQYAKEVDYWGMVSGRDVDKVAKSGLTAVPSELVDAPYIQEFPVAMECKLLHTVEIGSHTQFIGEVLDIKVDQAMLGPEGRPDVEKLGVFVYFDGYREIGEYLAQPFSIGKELVG